MLPYLLFVMFVWYGTLVEVPNYLHCKKYTEDVINLEN